MTAHGTRVQNFTIYLWTKARNTLVFVRETYQVHNMKFAYLPCNYLVSAYGDLGDNYDLTLALAIYAVRSSNTCAKLRVGVPWGTWNRLVQKRKESISSYGNTWPLLTVLKACDTFSPVAPIWSWAKKLAMLPPSTVYAGQQYDTKHLAFEYLLYAVFAADTTM